MLLFHCCGLALCKAALGAGSVTDAREADSPIRRGSDCSENDVIIELATVDRTSSRAATAIMPPPIRFRAVATRDPVMGR